MIQLSTNQFQCEIPHERITFTFELSDNTTLLPVGTFIRPDSGAHLIFDGNEENVASFTVDEFTELQIAYHFNSASDGVCVATITGNGGDGTFRDIARQRIDNEAVRRIYTFNPAA